MNNLLDKIKFFLTNMLESVAAIYMEKGFEPFKKPLLYSLPIIFGLYFFVYSPTISKLSNKKVELRNIESIAEFFDDYKNAKSRIAAFQRQLPATKDKGDWLNHVLTSTAKVYKVDFDSISAQKEVEISGYYIVSRGVSLTTTYDKVGKLICDIENSPIFLKVTDFNLKKDPVKRGYVKVDLTLSTVFSKVFMDN
ncbi:MAG: type 4a pilus biogenesis protein PilO [Elusimicrobia bacterium]|nr:type 4a pilus biogenesis protein PilO [Elusimicrobiota bacterium]